MLGEQRRAHQQPWAERQRAKWPQVQQPRALPLSKPSGPNNPMLMALVTPNEVVPVQFVTPPTIGWTYPMSTQHWRPHLYWRICDLLAEPPQLAESLDDDEVLHLIAGDARLPEAELITMPLVHSQHSLQNIKALGSCGCLRSRRTSIAAWWNTRPDSLQKDTCNVPTCTLRKSSHSLFFLEDSPVSWQSHN